MTIILITSSMVLAVVALSFVVNEVVTFRKETEKGLVVLADILGNNTAAAVEFNDQRSAGETLAGLKAKRNIIGACVITKDGILLAEYLPPGALRSVILPNVSEDGRIDPSVLAKLVLDGNHWGLRHDIKVVRPIILDSQQIGTVVIQSDSGELIARLLWFFALVLFISLVATLLAYVLSSRLQHFISDPIMELAQVMKTVSADKNYSTRAQRKSDDELGSLIDGFNEMLGQIEARDEMLNRHRDVLEEQVELRTTELSGTNLELERIVEELRESNSAAQAANLAKSQFLANMSHEIRTPMNGVLGMIGILLRTSLSSDQRRFAETVLQSGESLLEIINNILDISKIEAGRMELESIGFDLHKTVAETMEIFAAGAQNKGVELAFLIDSKVTRFFEGDPVRLRQILTNLIGNALKFTAQGEVVVRIGVVNESEETTQLIFDVTDTGIGIATDAQKGIFDSFSQADGSTTRKYGGTGLGLSISRQLATLMGGTIGVESEPGKGSVFWFTARLKKHSGAIDTTQPSEDILQGVKVLLVDDNTTNLYILQHQVTSWGMLSDTVMSGNEALEKLRLASAIEPYTLAIIDMHMPGMDGIELAHAIKDEPGILPTLLVMLTSVNNTANAEEMQGLGIRRCLSKPVSEARLYDCLSSVMASRDINHAEPAIHVPFQGVAEFDAKILVAEDNMTNQEVAKCILISLGCRVDLAENGCQAVEMSENASYDLIFMDCQMPVMDGFAATRAIRTRESGENKGSSCICSNLPIISLTANALSGDRDLCLAAGMDDYLSKPFNFEQMRAILKQWLPDKCVRAALPDEVGLAANSPNTAAPEAIPPDDASAIFNRNELKVRLGGNEAVIERFVAMFIGNTTNSLVSLKDAVEKGDCEKIRLHTHALKGAAGNIAAGTMRKLATAIETDAETGGLTNVTQLFMSLEKAFTAFKSVVGDSEPSLSEINPK